MKTFFITFLKTVYLLRKPTHQISVKVIRNAESNLFYFMKSRQVPINNICSPAQHVQNLQNRNPSLSVKNDDTTNAIRVFLLEM